MKPTVLVLCGGKSAERLVSLVSAQCVVANLDKKRFKVRLIHIGTDNGWVEVSPKNLLAETPKNLHQGGGSISRLRRGAKKIDPWKLLSSLGRGPLTQNGSSRTGCRAGDRPGPS